MTGQLTFIDLKPTSENFLDAVTAGLAATPKTLPAKFFYDQRGSKLFEDITNLEEYYQTRTEIALLKTIAPELKRLIPAGSKLVEFGSGSSEKIRVLIDQVGKFVTYIPIDISRDYLKMEAEALASDHPDLNIIAICADYTKPFEVPAGMTGGEDCTGFFPGSTIGNMTPGEMAAFMLYLTILQMPVRMLGFIVNMFARAHSAGARIFEILDAESAVVEKPDAPPLRVEHGEVEFEHVSFGYTAVSPVLHDVSIHAKP
ncbi:MAG: L-histidine N(alpha)-methyltransferase, partial [Proteobacteria bacterium]|nr:L-histidine N(alpha)-methyltransferase [Pseudomonadota bacterium]